MPRLLTRTLASLDWCVHASADAGGAFVRGSSRRPRSNPLIDARQARHDLDQRRRFDWLGDVYVETCFACARRIFPARIRGQRKSGNHPTLFPREGPDLANQSIAILARKTDVAKENIRSHARKHTERVLRRSHGYDFSTCRTKHLGQTV